MAEGLQKPKDPHLPMTAPERWQHTGLRAWLYCTAGGVAWTAQWVQCDPCHLTHQSHGLQRGRKWRPDLGFLENGVTWMGWTISCTVSSFSSTQITRHIERGVQGWTAQSVTREMLRSLCNFRLGDELSMNPEPSERLKGDITVDLVPVLMCYLM